MSQPGLNKSVPLRPASKNPGAPPSHRLSSKPGRTLRLCGWLLAACVLPLQGCHAAQSSAGHKMEHVRLLNLAGQEVNPFKSDSKWLLFIFVSVDCPVSNRYAPEIRRLHAKFADKGVSFWLVHPNADEAPETIRKHLEEYHYPGGVLRDPRHLLVAKAQVRVTPEAALFDRSGELLYRGRIDNRFVQLGVERPAPTERDLENALQAVVSGKPVPHPTTTAVGCYIPEL